MSDLLFIVVVVTLITFGCPMLFALLFLMLLALLVSIHDGVIFVIDLFRPRRRGGGMKPKI